MWVGTERVLYTAENIGINTCILYHSRDGGHTNEVSS